jgi:hypothetical protein
MNAIFRTTVILAGAACLLASPACRQKERVLDVETPAGNLKVDKDKKTGDVEIKVEDKKK